MNELLPPYAGGAAQGATCRIQTTKRALAAAAPVDEMPEAEKVQRLHSELNEPEAGRSVEWTDRDRRNRAHEIRQALSMMGDVV